MSLEEIIAEANARGVVVNFMSQLNRPEGVTWSVSVFRRRSPKNHAYLYSNGEAEALKDALLAAIANSDHQVAKLDKAEGVAPKLPALQKRQMDLI